ncbi:phosphatidylglycerol specific phospholipase C [Phycomyces blakesleeanus]
MRSLLLLRTKQVPSKQAVIIITLFFIYIFFNIIYIYIYIYIYLENGASEKIKNVVLLVLENRSFDRMMGWFKYNKDIDGLTGAEFNYVDPSDPSSQKIYATRNGLLKDPLDPAHGYQDVTYQISGDPTLASDASMKEATMGGFVQNFVKTFEQIKDNATAIHQIMDGFEPSKIPITYELASNYTIMNRYFSSFPGSTMPNRLYVHSGTSNGEANTDGTHYIKGYSQKTIYNNLDDAGIEWKNYYEEVPSLIVFTKLRAKLNRFKNWSTFKSDAASGNLPPVSFLDPAYFGIANCIVEDDNHPPADVAQGERLLKDVYETLRASPQWNETLFIVTYDEHGGYHDHVPTPLKAPNPDGVNVTDFNFNRLGVRVPTLLISPWVEKGGVIGKADGPYPDSEYEHSSIPATIKKIFNLPNFLTKRDAWAGTFEGAITENKLRTDCPATLSPPPTPVTTAIPTKLGMYSSIFKYFDYQN